MARSTPALSLGVPVCSSLLSVDLSMFLCLEINGDQQVEWDGPFQSMDVKRHGGTSIIAICDNLLDCQTE